MQERIPYTIVEPGFEFIDSSMDYMKFLEVCTRTCYKSEDRIGEGTAERLLKKVVNDFGHYSVTEHQSCIMDFVNCKSSDVLLLALMGMREVNASESRRLFGSRATLLGNTRLRLSGNIRMWRDLEIEFLTNNSIESAGIRAALHEKWPFFFEEPGRKSDDVRLLDENPLTNKDELSVSEMKRHMTMTYRLIGSRSMSHQLVRHRLAAYSQESQRYCDGVKKGFQFIIPPSIKAAGEFAVGVYVAQKRNAYSNYLWLREMGIPPEDAREDLPNACKTEVVTTYTLGIWDHFHGHRTLNKKAQWQIKGNGKGILQHQAECIPLVFDDLKAKLDRGADG